MEFGGLSTDAIGKALATQAGRNLDDEDRHQIGKHPSHGEIVDSPHRADPQPPGRPLISE